MSNAAETPDKWQLTDDSGNVHRVIEYGIDSIKVEVISKDGTTIRTYRRED